MTRPAVLLFAALATVAAVAAIYALGIAWARAVIEAVTAAASR